MDLRRIFENPGTWVICTALLLALLAWYLYSRWIERVRLTVKENSEYYRNVLALNQKYKFRSDIPEKGILSFFEQETTKAKYDRRSFESILYENLQRRLLAIQQALKNVDTNRELYYRYQCELSGLCSKISDTDCKRLNVPLSRFTKEEQKMIASIFQHPIITLQAQCAKEYTSPAGRNKYHSEYIFSEKTIQDTVDKIQEDVKRKSTEAYRRKTERQRVTEKLRYQVMRRDGFRCQLCRATQADGVKLHVDHIIPVSKGGTSDIGNLRTLCDRCNRGKGDQFEF